MGPSTIFKLPDKLYLIVIGMAMQAFFSPICFIQCLPEAMEAVQAKYNLVDNFNPEIDGLLSDTLSSMYTLFYSLASLLWPIIGGALYDWKHYQFTMNFFSIFMLFTAIIFIVFNCGCALIFKKEQNRKQVVHKLRSMSERIL